MEKDMKEKTTTGISANVSALLCYLGGFITGIIFYLVEKENKYVRFHAIQSTVLFGGLCIFNLAASMILPDVLKGLVSTVVGLASLILWIVLMIKGYQGEKFMIPVAGDVAEKHI